MDSDSGKIWSDIARAYEKVVIRTSFYREFMSDVCSEVLDDVKLLCKKKPKKEIKILDVGCGVGSLIDELLSKEPELQITGIDSNEHMLTIAKKEVIKPGHSYKLIQADAESFSCDEAFDIVVSTNLLFSLEKPFDFINNVHNLLNKDGYFILSSMKENPDFTVLANRINAEFKKPEFLPYIRTIEKLNAEMMNSRFRTFSNEKILEYLSFYCFQTILSNKNTFQNQNFLLNTRKKEVGKITINLESDEKAFENAWNLKYFLLSEILNVIPSEGQDLSSTYDQHSELLTARDAETNLLLGFQNCINDSPLGFPCEKTVDLSALRQKYGKMVSFAGTYVIPPVMGNRMAAFLLTYFHELMMQRGAEAAIAESNPEFSNFAKSIGYEEYSGGCSKTDGGLDKVDLLLNFQNPEKIKLSRKTLEKARAALGIENLLINV
jgi:2-polyprenyl-3-methyl-5-hydroxy-6-metoxy-1,4-benzoquinol methylase